MKIQTARVVNLVDDSPFVALLSNGAFQAEAVGLFSRLTGQSFSRNHPKFK